MRDTYWLVGSSRSKNSGFKNNALARVTLMRHPVKRAIWSGSTKAVRKWREGKKDQNILLMHTPPLNSLVIMPCILVVNPKPYKILDALASAVLTSRSSSFSYTISSCC